MSIHAYAEDYELGVENRGTGWYNESDSVSHQFTYRTD